MQLMIVDFQRKNIYFKYGNLYVATYYFVELSF